MKKINISTKKHPNTFSAVDDSDFNRINANKWHPLEIRGKLYAKRKIMVGGEQKTLYMHTAIIGKVEGAMVDHRDGNGLNNQRYNLRHCTNAQNLRNQSLSINNTSGYKGVWWSKRSKKWHSVIRRNGKQFHLGYYFCLIKAAKVYDEAAVEYYGEFARLNFPSK